MRTQKLLFFCIVLLLVATSVSAATFRDRVVNVKVAESGSQDPIQGATVTLTREDTLSNYDLSPTNSTGYSKSQTINIDIQNPPLFKIIVSAPGYETLTLTHQSFSDAIVSTYKTFSIFLSDDATVAEAGIITEVQLKKNENCPAGFTQKGEFIDYLYSATNRLCVKYAAIENFVQGSVYVNLVYLEEFSGEDHCTQGGTASATFSSNSVPVDLCVNKKNVQSLTEQHAVETFLASDQSACSSYNLVTGPFYDKSGTPFYSCTKLANYNEGSQSSCQLSDPKWINQVPQIISTAVGTDPTDDETIPGDQEVYLSATAPQTCKNKVVVFELYEGSDLIGWTSKSILSSASWNNNLFYVKWPPIWIKQTGPGANENSPTYYRFKAKIQGTSQQTDYSPILTVNKPRGIECTDDTDCSTGQVCDSGACVAECTKDSDCETGMCHEQSGKCAECLKDKDCTDSEEFGDNYKCDLNEQSDKRFKCVPLVECTISDLTWTSEDGNALDLTKAISGTTTGNECVCGDKVNLIAKATGCADKEVTFKIYEQDGWSDDEVDSRGVQNDKYFFHESWKPPWNIPNFLSQLVEGGELEYYFTAVSSDDPDTEIGKSPILKVQQPADAQCDYPSTAQGAKKCAAGLVCNECRQCVPECSDASDCSAAKPYCNAGACVECLSTQNCTASQGANYICKDFSCTNECTTETESQSCTDTTKPKCDPEDKICVECLKDDDCGGKQSCKNNKCVACTNNLQCKLKSIPLTILETCNTETNKCEGPAHSLASILSGLKGR